MQPNTFQHNRQGKKLNSKKLFLSFLTMFLCINSLMASHFRYGLVTATRLSETSTTVTYRINVSEAWRLASAPGSSPFTISGGNTGSFSVPMTTVTDPSGGWSNNTGSATITLNKTTTPTRIEYTSCCKVSTTINNHDASWDEYIILNTSQPGSSPVSSLPAIINLPINALAATYSIPASDPDAGSTLTFGLPNLVSGPLAGQTEPTGFSINSSGLISMNTVGKTVGQLYNALVTVTDNNGNQIMLDFIIQMVGASNPPVFDYTTTPTNGTVFNVIAGQNLSFPIKASDVDAGSTVKITASGLPSYITTTNFTPNLPVTANPVTTTFSWTPGAAQIGTTNVLNFIATDNVGVQTTTSVTIKVVAQPAPVFISPTPVQNSLKQIVTGVQHNDTITAQSSLGSNVSISLATIPITASMSPTVPTVGTNPGLSILSWTPTPANFGEHNLSFTASISGFPTIFAVRNYSLIVNTPPEFSSTPTNLSINAGQSFSYNVTINDPDIPYGDTVDIVGATIPSWLTLVSTGNGTAVLSGTPTFADGGVHQVILEAEDIYHHGNPSHVEQEFEITVITCVPPVISCPSDISLNSTAGLCGAVATYNVSATGSTPTITYSVASGSVFPIGTTQVKVYATNDCGTDSCSFNIIVTDVESPVITCGTNISVNTDAGKCGATVSFTAPTATDNCSVVSVDGVRSDALALSADYPVGTTTITWTAVDASGLTATCTQTVTVTDAELPNVLTQPVTVSLDANGVASITVAQIDNGSSDNCGIASITLDNTSFDCSKLGANTVVLTVIDIHGNTNSSTAVVTIEDHIAPVISCPNSVTVNCHDNASVAALGSATATDNCSAIVSYVDASTQNANTSVAAHYNYTITRTWTAVDPAGNSASCVQTITVQDITSPTAICKTATVALVNGVATITANDVNNNSYDNCSDISLAVSKTTFTCTNIGVNEVVLTVTDASGNKSSCTATVNVVGEIPTCSITSVPTSSVFTGGVSTNLYFGYGAQSTKLQVNAPLSGAPYTYSWTGVGLSSSTSGNPIFTPTATGSYNFVVLVTNKYGCKTSCSITICVRDVRVPGTNGNKVYICHVPPGNAGNPQTLSISVNAVPSHLGLHADDKLGSCDLQPCTNAPIASISKDAQVSVSTKFDVVVAPNPSTSYFELAIKTSNESLVSIKVMDANGRLVESFSRIAPTSYITFGSNYSAGIYFVEIVQGKERKTLKLLKVK